MAQFREREEDENDGVPVDLKQKVCPTCRRKLQPWEATCPEDGALPVAGVEMGAVEDGILGRLNPDLLAGLEEEIADDPPQVDRAAWDEFAPADDEVITVQTEAQVVEPPARPVNFDETKWGGA